MEDTNLYVNKAEHDAVVQEVELLKAALAKAQEDKERAIFLTKAQEYASMPISPSELADFTYWLSKTDAARYEWFEAVLKATDNQLRDAGLFVEKGTSTPYENDALAAAMKSEDPRAALLSLDRKAAERYLRETHRAIKEA